MRDELHVMELVDRYLDGAMDALEQAGFEQRMGTDADLRWHVNDQRALREGLVRSGLRSAAAKAHRVWLLKHMIPWVGAGLFPAGVAVYLLMPSNEARGHEGNPDTYAPRPTTVTIAVSADSAASELVEATRVETVFMRTTTPRTTALDTSGRSGRVVSWEIKGQAPAHPVPQEIALIASDPGKEDGPVVVRNDSMPAANPPLEPLKPLLATVEIPANATAQPSFPGGMEQMQDYLAERIRQPRGTRKSGVVTIGFTVNRKGEVVNAEVVHSMGRVFDAEALRVVRTMPVWSPARVGDRPVKSKVEVPVRFNGGKPAIGK